MDPVTVGALITTATASFNAVKKLVSAGREIEDVAGQLGAWFTAMSDIKEARSQAQNPSFLKKKLSQQSVEQEALDTMIAEKKIEEQEAQLRELIMWTYGEQALRRMYQMRREIKARREAEVYRKMATRRKMREAAIIAVALSGCALVVVMFFRIIASV